MDITVARGIRTIRTPGLNTWQRGKPVAGGASRETAPQPTFPKLPKAPGDTDPYRAHATGTTYHRVMSFVWSGSAAKTRIVRSVLATAAAVPERTITVLDLGCGACRGWPAALAAAPNLRLIGYDPSPLAVSEARNNLGGYAADLVGMEVLQAVPLQSDVVISLSVLEHVFDRHSYLGLARKHITSNGIFHLSYDDGHFRRALSADRRSEAWSILKEWLINASAASAARLGSLNRYQSRVDRGWIDAAIARAGFDVVETRYENLSALKDLWKLVEPSAQTDFMNDWIAYEETLNLRYAASLPAPRAGDVVNLWQVMPTRSLVLRPAP